jgi:2-succinyl-5-enolpyruvyl-6-hydroxy-3-cyclohexene-1-carboxylate synthase
MPGVADAPNPNHAFAAAFFAELVASGVAHACLSPGSRSTPLTVAAVRQPGLRCWSILDERSAGFFALGLAKASRSPVALVCTSGTAAANYHPAVIEAHHARVPLLVLTADRPPELRDWGAGQTIDQLSLYGSALRWFAEAPVPGPGEGGLRHARALACRAAGVAHGRPCGPVHLNFPFREPLAPDPSDIGALSPESPAVTGRGTAYTEVERSTAAPSQEQAERLAERLSGTPRGVVSCGPLDAPPEAADAIAELARALGWPLLAEPTSQLRRGPRNADCIGASDLFLRHAATAQRLAPDAVLRFGDTPTSKAFRLWLEARPPQSLLRVDPDGVWHDPSHLASGQLPFEPAELCRALLPHLKAPAETPWRADWRETEERACRAIDAVLADEPALQAPEVVRVLGECVQAGSLLYVANSMAVRDLDGFLPPGQELLRVLCNRGANGIDGTLSSAFGAAAAGEAPLTLLTGDLAFLHDAGGLLAAKRHGVTATVVVLDDDGGGIFSYLPVAAHGEAVGFEEQFATPHGLDLGAVADAYGARFTRVASREHLRSALKTASEESGVSVIVIPLDRARNVAHHREIHAAVARALEPAA